MPVAGSLRARVLIWVGVAAAVLFAVTIVGLDWVLRETTNQARAELLDTQLLGLIALAETGDDGRLTIPESAVHQRFSLADSGLYGVLRDVEGKTLWQSPSLAGHDFPAIELPEPGQQRSVRTAANSLPPLDILAMGIRWGETGAAYTFATAVSMLPYEEQQWSFRRNLISWFAVITLIMLVVMTGVLGWVMRPVRTLEVQVGEVESGERERLTGDYPTELEGLAENLNVLIETERRRLTRYRNTLDDLAHGLKTPLAAMRALLGDSTARAGTSSALDRELDRMDQRITHQLRRARASGASGLGLVPIEVGPVVDDLGLTLDKVYRDKAVKFEAAVEPGTRFHGDEGDLMELLGNLMENACKYCRGRVATSARNIGDRLQITVEDDGPGMDETAMQVLLERGRRADESIPGQGIGLAVVKETVELYGGRISVTPSALGGAAVTVELGRPGMR